MTRRLVRSALLFLALTNASCRSSDPVEASYPPAYGAPNPGQWQPPTAAPAATPYGPSTALSPAFGLPCASDQDFQCPFGHCNSGRCGGCFSTAECKAGATCAPSPFGMACMPGFGPAAPAAPAPAPWPTASPAPFPTAPPASGGSLDAARQRCVDGTNAYRARLAAPPLARRTASEACADGQSSSDAASGKAHGTFGACQEFAQNACPYWPGPPEAMVDGCLADMFAEGPGEPFSEHGHYLNMVSLKYTSVACGFAVTSDGRVWMVQDFF